MRSKIRRGPAEFGSSGGKGAAETNMFESGSDAFGWKQKKGNGKGVKGSMTASREVVEGRKKRGRAAVGAASTAGPRCHGRGGGGGRGPSVDGRTKRCGT